MKKLLMAAVAVLSLGAVVAPAQASVVVGTADTGSSIPFGSTTAGYYFQQVYAASNFTEALDLYRLTFFNTKSPTLTVSPTGRFEIFLSVVNTNIATFDTSNSLTVPYLAADFVQVFDGVIPTLSNGKLNLNLLQGFNYDPSQGQLMVTIRSDDLSAGTLALDVDNTTSVINSRMSSFGYNWNQGLVTGFNAAVPEPATWALMLGGFGLAGAALRRRRSVAA